MEEFLEAIDQLVTADRVRELIRRYDLSQAMGDDLSDEGLPREYYLESKMHGIRYYMVALVYPRPALLLKPRFPGRGDFL